MQRLVHEMHLRLLVRGTHPTVHQSVRDWEPAFVVAAVAGGLAIDVVLSYAVILLNLSTIGQGYGHHQFQCTR